MWVESWALNEEEKKKKKLTEKQEQENRKKIIEHQKVKEEIAVEIETEDEIFHLKELVEKWVITQESAQKIIDWEELDEKIVKEIFEKIDEMEEIKDIDEYIPKELRISHEEYDKALHDDIFRTQMITKLDSALALVAKQINPGQNMGLNLFSGFLAVLDKNLIKVQEHTIDVKDSLKEIDEKKFWKKQDSRTFMQKFLDFLND